MPCRGSPRWGGLGPLSSVGHLWGNKTYTPVVRVQCWPAVLADEAQQGEGGAREGRAICSGHPLVLMGQSGSFGSGRMSGWEVGQELQAQDAGVSGEVSSPLALVGSIKIWVNSGTW